MQNRFTFAGRRLALVGVGLVCGFQSPRLLHPASEPTTTSSFAPAGPAFDAITSATAGGFGGPSSSVLDDLVVVIVGESDPLSSEMCRYYAELSLSSTFTEPLSYEWRLGWDNTVLGTGSYFDAMFGHNESTQVVARVRDANGREGWAYMSVNASNYGNLCGR